LHRGARQVLKIPSTRTPAEGARPLDLGEERRLRLAEAGGTLTVQQVVRGSAAERERGLRRADRVLGANGRPRRHRRELGREVLRGSRSRDLLLAVEHGRFVYNLGFSL